MRTSRDTAATELISRVTRDLKLPPAAFGFLSRVYGQPEIRYLDRLSAAGFVNRSRVLDAGCGFGQWSIAMARHNEDVVGLDSSRERVKVARMLADELNCDGASFLQGELTNLPFSDESFNGVFCYSAIHLGDYRVALSEFARILSSGGLAYFTANDIGWYLHNLVAAPNASADFSPRLMALKAFGNAVLHRLGALKAPHGEIMIRKAAIRRAAVAAGFVDIQIAPEGGLPASRTTGSDSAFYPASKYWLPNVYEVTCRKP